MKTILWTGLLSAALNLSALGALYTYNSGFQNGGIIPDGTANGWTDSRTISGLGAVITDVNVVINVSGGYNGDLYAYLSHNGILVPLLNRVGTGSGDVIQQTLGFSTAGFSNVRLDDAGSLNIHDVATPSSSPTSYRPDGGSLASFSDINPNGNWTLFYSDLANAGGSSSSTLVSWSLDITAVPEPVNVALGIFGGVFLVAIVGRHPRVQKRLRGWRLAVVSSTTIICFLWRQL